MGHAEHIAKPLFRGIDNADGIFHPFQIQANGQSGDRNLLEPPPDGRG